ncbi:glycosyltransferase [Microbacterium sp. Mu-80]|uniref:Glycosyltransferase n=1 Tax=Microbacterium bandirmense TaxID=3122050 RepID=A0ABU8LDE0_9MICO
MPRITAVTVTYGDRFDRLCRETIERAFAAGVSEMVVVDNGSTESSSAALSRLAAASDRLTVLRNERNIGSAAAFGAALTEARQGDPDFIWLLDDDNWVAPETLDRLISVHQSASTSEDGGGVVVCARRVPNSFHDRVNAGVAADAVYPLPGAFLGFDVMNYASRFLRPPTTTVGHRTPPRIPYAPYGGLLIRSEILDEVGPPRGELVLYSDDTVWTSGIVAAGHPIVLALDAVIEDADGKWTQGSSKNSVSASIRSQHTDRLYLSTRNRTWYDRSRVSTTAQRLRYALNRIVVLGVAALSAVPTSSWRGFRAFRRAIRDGERGDFSETMRLG